MKATRYILLAAAALLFAACTKDNQEQDSYSFSLNVRNEDYLEEVVLQGVGDAEIASADNLPHWIAGVMLREEKTGDDPVAVVGVKADINLEDSRTANIILKMSNGKTVNLELTQWAILRESTNAAYKSANTNLEKNWYDAQTVDLITGNQTINGRQELIKKTVPLPWAWDASPICFLPKGDGRDETNEVVKMIDNKADWSLVFNLTGINAFPGRNYFGLYNRYTGTLRVFYYLTQDLIPENANDHLWSFALNSVLAEHVSTEFALPRQEEATRDYLARAARPVLTSPTTDAYNPLSGQTSNTLAEGWWAFDVNMAAYRNHKFFNENDKPLSAATIQLCTFSSQNVVLNSVLQGNLGGDMTGSINLELLRPSKVAMWAQITSSLVGAAGSIATNTYFLNEGVNGKRKSANQQQDVVNINVQDNNGANPPVVPGGNNNAANAPALRSQTKSFAVGIASLVVGIGLSIASKYIEKAGTEKIEDKNFGALNATLNLDLNAVMATQGTIGGGTPNKVPPVTMSMDYFKQNNQDADNTPTCMGEGVWNLEHHPVVYVVNDAYWYENKFTVLSSQREYQVGGSSQYPEDVYSYNMGRTKGSRPGLRLITFMDPTSIGGAALNPNLFTEALDRVRVYLSYGVYPGSTAGYSDAFRRDLGLDYPHSWRLFHADKFTADSLKLVKKPHTDELFKWCTAPDEVRSIAGYRLSSQGVNTKYPRLERRYFGQSCYFEDPYATDFTVDKVHFVYDPQVYVPFDDAGYRLYDPQVPDFIVTAMVNAYGKDQKDTDEAVLSNTLRFVPKVVLVSYKDLPTIMAQIKDRQQKMSGPVKDETIFVEMKSQIDHIQDIVNATESLRTPPKK